MTLYNDRIGCNKTHLKVVDLYGIWFVTGEVFSNTLSHTKRDYYPNYAVLHAWANSELSHALNMFKFGASFIARSVIVEQKKNCIAYVRMIAKKKRQLRLIQSAIYNIGSISIVFQRLPT